MKNDEIIAEIRSIISGNIVDNEEIAEILREHGCYYLLSKLPMQKQTVQMELMVNRLVISKRYKICANVFEQLNKIPYAVIKGAVLSKQIYGNTAYRFSGDIDLIVSPENAEIVKTILIDNGFIQGRVVDDKIIPYTRRELIYQKTFSHQLAAFVKATDDRLCPFINIDVNTDIMWGESEVKTDMDQFLSKTIPYEINGIKVKKLSPEEEFISLCLHHYKDMNSIYLLSQGSFKLSLLCDIYFFLNNAELDLSKLTKLCEKYGVSEYVYFCVYHTSNLLVSDKQKKLLSKLHSESSDKLINRFGLADDEYHTWDKPIVEYLFDNNLKDYIFSKITDAEKEKIAINMKMM